MRAEAIESYLRLPMKDVTTGVEDTLLVQIGQEYRKPFKSQQR